MARMVLDAASIEPFGSRSLMPAAKPSTSTAAMTVAGTVIAPSPLRHIERASRIDPDDGDHQARCTTSPAHQIGTSRARGAE